MRGLSLNVMEPDLDFEDIPRDASRVDNNNNTSSSVSAPSASLAPPSPSSSSSRSLSPDPADSWPARDTFTFGRPPSRSSPPVAPSSMTRSPSPLGGPVAFPISTTPFPRSPSLASNSPSSSRPLASPSPRLPGSPNPAGPINRHRRKSSVSITPPFPRSPSPTVNHNVNCQPGCNADSPGSPGLRSPFWFSPSAFMNHTAPGSALPRSPNGVHEWPAPAYHSPHAPRAPSPLPQHILTPSLCMVDEHSEDPEAPETPSPAAAQSLTVTTKLLPASVITPTTASVSLLMDSAAGTSSRLFPETSSVTSNGSTLATRRARAGSRSGLEDLMSDTIAPGGPQWRRGSLDSLSMLQPNACHPDSLTPATARARSHSATQSPILATIDLASPSSSATPLACSSTLDTPHIHAPGHHFFHPELLRNSTSSPTPKSPLNRPSSPTRLKSGRFMTAAGKKAPPPLDLSFTRDRTPSPLSSANERNRSPKPVDRSPAATLASRRKSLDANFPSPPSLPVIPRSPAAAHYNKHDLALPPRSGWDQSDDPNDSPPTTDLPADGVSPTEEPLDRALSDWPLDVRDRLPSLESFQNGAVDRTPEEEEQRAAEWRITVKTDEVKWGVNSGLQGDDEMKLAFGGLRSSLEASATLGNVDVLDGERAFGGGGGGGEPELQEDLLVKQENQLSPLERIFLLAKSERSYHRVFVSQKLFKWVEEVDICEAVEYILPLLNSLGTDEEAVREAFAPTLCNIMWYFFNKCQLLEIDDDAVTPQASVELKPEALATVLSNHRMELKTLSNLTADSFSDDWMPPGRSRERADSGPGSANSSATSSATNHSEDVGSHTSATSCDILPDCQESPTLEIVDRPRISASVFTALLGALLADVHEPVAAYARYGFLTFLCRLTGRGKPDDSDLPADAQSSGILTAFEQRTLHDSAGEALSHKHNSYDMTEEARGLIESEMIDGIVLALANLDADVAGDGDETTVSSSASAIMNTTITPTSSSDTPTLSSINISEADQDKWADVPLDRVLQESYTSNFFNDLDEHMRSTFSDTASDFGAPFSSGQQAQADEASMGRHISMSLIAAISQAGCLAQSTLTEKLLPEVAKMPRESVHNVRQQASLTLATLSAVLPGDVVAEQSIPLFKQFADDPSWQVRRQACLGLPSIVSHLKSDLRATLASEAISQFAADCNNDVRSAVYQILGQIIYAFHQDLQGVPQDILDLYIYGSSKDQENELAYGAHSSHRLNSLTLFSSAAPFSSLFCEPGGDRLMACAYNLPAVALTIGPSRWSELRGFYHTLVNTNSRSLDIRHTLACSLHEVAKIIGRESATADLPVVFVGFLNAIPDVVMASVEHLAEFFACLEPAMASCLVKDLYKVWEGMTATVSQWRVREKVMLHAPELVKQLGRREDCEHDFIGLLIRSLRDPVSAVRDAGIAFIPALLTHTTESEDNVRVLSSVLSGLARDGDFRLRMVFGAALGPIIRLPTPHCLFVTRLTTELCRLGTDKVAGVRIGVARVVKELCTSKAFYADLSTRPQDITDLVVTLSTDTEFVVRSFVAQLQPTVAQFSTSNTSSPLSPPSSPIPISSIQSDEDASMEEDEMASSGVQVIGSMDSLEVVGPLPHVNQSSSSSRHERYRSSSPVSPIDMDLETIDLSGTQIDRITTSHHHRIPSSTTATHRTSSVNNNNSSSNMNQHRSSSLSHTSKQWSLSGIRSSHNYSLPVKRSLSTGEDMWMMKETEGFVEVCEF